MGALRPHRASLLAALALLATPAPAGAAAWEPDVAAAREWASKRSGSVSFTVQSGPRTAGFRSARAVPAASLMKTLFLVAHLRRGDVRD
ncbi:MAG: hypothetical protein JWO90_227, partial [Solirubrobacterales bacterium]|nr:hypothetical protein [Solirubrobacterales bacterium]